MGVRAEEIADKWIGICLVMLREARTQLYLDMRYLDLPLSALSFSVTTQLQGIGTDGSVLAAHPKILSDLYEKDPRLINRVYLHIVMHCLLRHPFKKNREEETIWDLACDIAAESVIDSLSKRSVRMGVSRLRKNWDGILHQTLKVLTAEGVFHVLEKMREKGDLSLSDIAMLQQEFGIDDHSLWPSKTVDEQHPRMEQMRSRWQDISEKTQTKMDTFSEEESSGDGDLKEQLTAENRERYDYRNFLRRFAVFTEELKADPDTFDYIFYTFGLSEYGNMPLIEPQEFREVKKIDEFVIVLDVSMSTSGPLIREFLNQTYDVLSEKETYLHKVNIRILQCDDQVRSDRKITTQEEMEEYLKSFTLTGGGGTDFRPAFTYVKDLLENGDFSNLRGMLYFTDGKGTYPKMRPPWETAFVFLEEDYTDREVPPWAIKLILSREDLEEEEPQKGLTRSDYRFLE